MMILTPEQAKLSGHAQDAFHYALLASGDTGLSSFVGDRGTVHDAIDEGYPDSPRGLALYALARSIHYAAQAEIAIPFRWRPAPKSRRTLAQVRAAAEQLLVAVREASQAVGWNAYNDGLLADYPTGPGAEGWKAPAADHRPCLACARVACAQAGYPGIDKTQDNHTCGKEN